MNELNQEKHSRTRFWSLLVLLLGLCFVRYALQVNFPQIVLLGLAVLIAFLGDRDEVMAMCICCIPLHTSLHYAYALLAGIVIYCIKFSGSVKINLSVVPILLMVLWELLHCFTGGFSVVTLVSDCVPLLMLVLVMSTGETEFDYSLIVRALAISIAAMCLLLLGKLVYAADFNLVTVFANLQRLGLDAEETKEGLEVIGGEQNPNTLGIMCVLGMTGLMQLRYAGRGKPADMLLVLFLLVFGVMTSSRTYLVCLALMIMLLLFSRKGSVAEKIKFLGLIILIAIVMLVMLYLLMPTLVEFYLGRFTVEDVTTGRMDLMQTYHEFIMSEPKNLFFGIGLQNFVTKVLSVYRIASQVPHNGIQELLVAWGAPGLAMFLVLWAAMIVQSRQRCRKQGLLNYIPLTIILVKAQAGQMLDSPYTMLAFSFAYLSMCADLTAPEPQALEEKT